MKNNLENQDIKIDKPVPMSYEALKADRDAQQKRAEALAVENAALKDAMHPELISDQVLDVFSDTAKYDHESCDAWSGSWIKNTDEVIMAVMGAMAKPETPATSAALAAIEARGVNWIEGNTPPDFGRYWVRYETDVGTQYCSAQWLECNFCASSNTNIHKIWLADNSRSINALRGVTHYTKLPKSLEELREAK